MGFMTLKDFREELNFSLGDRAQSSNIPLDRWINRSYFEVVGRMAGDLTDLHSVEVIATTACDEEYRVPAAAVPPAVDRRFLSILSVADLTNKRRLLYIPLRNYHLKDQALCSVPELYSKRGNQIILWPAPRSAFDIQVFGVLEPLPMAAETDTSLLPSALDHAILLFGTRNAFLSMRMKEDATLAFQAGMQYITAVQNEMQLNEGSPAVGVNIAESWDDVTSMRSDSMGDL